MSAPPERTCARTAAVLALHLDGDLAAARDPLGYAFVSEQSLHEHLCACGVCQQALQRARRLDATLAAAAGRELSDVTWEHGTGLAELGELWLTASVRRANASDDDTTGAADDTGDDLVCATTAASDADDASANPASSNAIARRPGRMLVAALAFAALVPWAWPAITAGDYGKADPREAAPERAVAHHAAAPDESALQPQPDTYEPGREQLAPSLPMPRGHQRPAAHPFARNLSRALAAARGERARTSTPPLGALAMSAHDTQPTTPAALAAAVLDATRSASERLALGRRLLAGVGDASAPSSDPDDTVTGLALDTLAGLGDRDATAAELLALLLEQARHHHALHAAIERGLHDPEPTDLAPARPNAHRGADAALVVAARLGLPSLDARLPQLVRTDDRRGPIVSAALRCGVRQHAAADVLLDCWRAEADARPAEDPAGGGMLQARRWFGGQPRATFLGLLRRYRDSSRADERVRCLLAMGCAADDTTLSTLLATLQSPRRDEALAAALALAALPHEVLRPLLQLDALRRPTSRHPTRNDAVATLVQAALLRARLPEAGTFGRHLTRTERDWIEAPTVDDFVRATAALRQHDPFSE